KAMGGWYLDEALRDVDLDAFVLFSSGTGTWGTGTQSAYSSANASLDALAAHRRARGLRATSIAWGSWAGAGMVHDAASGQYMERRGVIRMEPELAVAAMERVLRHDETYGCVADVEWSTFIPELNTTRDTPLYAALPDATRALNASSEPSDASDVDALSALSGAERQRALVDLVRSHTAQVLLLPGPEDGGETQTFPALGVDSLTGVELRNRLNKVTGLRLAASVVMDHPTPADLAGTIAEELPEAGDATPDRPETAVEPRDSLTGLLRRAGAAGRLNDTRRIVV